MLLLAPNRGNRGVVEFTWHGLDLIVGIYYLLTLLVFIAATACALVLPCIVTVRRYYATYCPQRRYEVDGQ